MTLLRGDCILRKALGATILCLVLLKENAANVQAASGSSVQTSPASTMTNNTSTTTAPSTRISTSSEENVVTFPTTGDESEDLIPPKVEDFARPCIDNIHSFIFNSIVAHNMNRAAAGALHHKTDNFKELARNISTTMMTFAEQISRLYFMYNLCTEPPIRVYPPSTSAPPTQASKVPELKKEDVDDSSDLTVPLLLLVILTLSAYIGYLSYKLKTKYYRNSNILIDDH